MSNLKLSIFTVLLAFAMVLSMGVASGGIPPTPLQSTADTEEPVAPNPPAVSPLAGFAIPAPFAPWVTEVRIPVVIENTAGAAVPADLTMLGEYHFTVVDSSGTAHGIDIAHPDRAALPSHSLVFVDPGMVARWTLGFRVPTLSASRLTLELRRGDAVATAWDVAELGFETPPIDLSGLNSNSVELDEEFAWAPGVSAAARGVGSLVCGDPTVEPVTHVFAVTFDIVNSTSAEYRWPGYIHRDGASVAQWSDGTAADMTMETYVGGAEELPRVSTHAVRIPPQTSTTRAMVFAAPRDGRFTDTRTLPVGVKLQTDLGTPWLDLTGAVADVAVSPLFCDIGFFGGPIPFGFTPGKKFDVGAGPKVGGEDTPIDPATFDERARQALAEGLAAAALYYDGSGQSFSEVAADDLVARAPRLSFVAHDPDSEPPGEVDTVYFALRPDDDRYFYAVTRSRSGRWFCAGVVPHISVVALDAFDLAEITKTCFPDTTVEEG